MAIAVRTAAADIFGNPSATVASGDALALGFSRLDEAGPVTITATFGGIAMSHEQQLTPGRLLDIFSLASPDSSPGTGSQQFVPSGSSNIRGRIIALITGTGLSIVSIGSAVTGTSTSPSATPTTQAGDLALMLVSRNAGGPGSVTVSAGADTTLEATAASAHWIGLLSRAATGTSTQLNATLSASEPWAAVPIVLREGGAAATTARGSHVGGAPINPIRLRGLVS